MAKVSVIMPVFNSERYIREAIQSVLNQSFTDFELIIINDGSTDKSLEIIRSFKDDRIVLVNNEKQMYTIMAARNRCLELSRGTYIAPLDSDDITHKDRLGLEVDFLEKNPAFGLVGSSVIVIDENGKKTGVEWKEKIPSEKIPIRLLFSNCFAQSSVMIRKSAIPKEGYIGNVSEDYPLWIRILKTWKAHKLPEFLLDYRVHSENSTSKKRALLDEDVDSIIRSQLEEFDVHPSKEELILHRTNYTFTGEVEEAKAFIAKREQWLLGLCEANQKTKRYDVKTFNEVMAERFLTTLEANSRLGFYYNWKKFLSSPISKNLNWQEEWQKLIKFFIKCLIKK